MESIDNHSNDEFYRYKMPKIIFTREKTKISINNLHEIAESIKTPIDILVNFIKNKLGTSLKERETDFIITDTINLDDIKSAIDLYIEYFVICYKCRLPEVLIKRKKFQTICNACGAKNDIVINKYTENTYKYCNKK